MRIHYDKLIRDRVPEAIAADGHACEVEVLEPEAYVTELRRKLVEEAREALEASSSEDLALELADVYEVIDALIVAAGVDRNTIKSLQRLRRAERGGFERRLFLRFVERVGPPQQ